MPIPHDLGNLSLRGLKLCKLVTFLLSNFLYKSSLYEDEEGIFLYFFNKTNGPSC